MFAKIVFFILITSVDSEMHKIGSNDTKANSMFVEVNSQLQGIWDGIFTSLKLDKNFTNKTKVDLMTTMTETLNNISEVHFKVYENIKNITAPDIMECDNETENQLFNLSCVIEEVFVENDYFLRNNIFIPNRSLKEFYRALVGSNATEIIIEVDSTETVENVTVDDEEPEEIHVNHNNTKRKTHTRHKKKHSKAYKINIDKKVRYQIRNTKYGLRAWRQSNLTLELENLSRTRRIFKSIRARIKRYPFVASIMILGEFVCAGSIISKHLVITAASCLQLAYQDKQFLRRPGAVTLRVGSDYTDRGGELLAVVSATFHPHYDPVYLKNNLVVMQLDRALDFMRGMKRIDYERSNRDVGHDITILGWGDKNNYNTYNGSLETARLQVFGLDPCRRIYSQRYVDETNFCAGYVDVGGGACNRDVGGPALTGSTLLGIINFGPPVCGSPNSPTVFTKLGNYVAWIDDVVLKTQATEAPPQVSSLRANKNAYNTESPNKDANLLSSPLRVLTSLFKNLVSRGNIDLNSILYPTEGFETNNIDNNLIINKIDHFYTQPRESPAVSPQYYRYSYLPNKITADRYQNTPDMDPGYDKVITPPSRQLQTNGQFQTNTMYYQTTPQSFGDDILKQIDRVRNYVEQHVIGEKMLRKNTESTNGFGLLKTSTPMSMSMFSQFTRKPTEPFFDLDLANDEDDDGDDDKDEQEDDKSDVGLNLDLDEPTKKSKYISEIDDELEPKKSEHRHLSKKKSNKHKKSKKHKHKKKHGGHKGHKGKKDPRRPLFETSIDKDNDSDDKESNDKHDLNPAHYHIEEDDDTWDLGLNRRSFLEYINM